MSRVHLTDKKILAAVCGVLLLAALWPVLKSLSPAMAIAEEDSPKIIAASTERTGYLATEYTNGYYLAAGTGGRLNKILPDKHVETLAVPTSESLTDIWTDGVSVLVCGKNGTLLLGDEACNFTKCNVGISSDIFGVTCFNGKRELFLYPKTEQRGRSRSCRRTGTLFPLPQTAVSLWRLPPKAIFSSAMTGKAGSMTTSIKHMRDITKPAVFQRFTVWAIPS